MTPKRRFDFATEMRAFAKRARALRFRGTERYLEELDQLARDMDERAAEVVRTTDPAPEGVFLTGPGRSASGRPFRAETRTRRLAAA